MLWIDDFKSENHMTKPQEVEVEIIKFALNGLSSR